MVCAAVLPLGPRPVFQTAASAKLLIVGQAPGARVHATGIPWNDASGDRLRNWLSLARAQFYDRRRVAILPIGLCYPGRLSRGGDASPRLECAPLWQARFRAALPEIRLTLLVGTYAQVHHLGAGKMEDRVRAITESVDYVALPHPSWRTCAWVERRPWFARDVLPILRARIADVMAD